MFGEAILAILNKENEYMEYKIENSKKNHYCRFDNNLYSYLFVIFLISSLVNSDKFTQNTWRIT